MWGEEGIERGNTNLASVHILQMKRKTFHARTWGGFTTRHQLETCSFLPGKALDWSIQKLDFSFHLASDKPRLLLIQPSRYLNLQNGIVSEVKPSPILVSASFGGFNLPILALSLQKPSLSISKWVWYNSCLIIIEGWLTHFRRFWWANFRPSTLLSKARYSSGRTVISSWSTWPNLSLACWFRFPNPRESLWPKGPEEEGSSVAMVRIESENSEVAG